MSTKLTRIGFFAVGAGIGAAVALLYAHRAGKHTRARILDTATGTIHRAEEVADDVDKGRARVEECMRVVAS